jgi:hypothetical protein
MWATRIAIKRNIDIVAAIEVNTNRNHFSAYTEKNFISVMRRVGNRFASRADS